MYLQTWLTSPSLTSAATNDLLLYKRLQKFKKIQKEVSSKTSSVLNRHTWYLTEELIPFSLFDENSPIAERSLLAAKIHSQATAGDLDIRKPTLPQINIKSEISDFVGGRSRLLFDLLKVPLGFLQHEDWHLLPEYIAVKHALNNLTPINDNAERALALATRVNTHITRDEDSYQELLQVVEAHRNKYGLKTKEDLRKFY